MKKISTIKKITILSFLLMFAFIGFNSCSSTKAVKDNSENQLNEAPVVEEVAEEVETSDSESNFEEPETAEEKWARRNAEFEKITENMSLTQKRFYAYKHYGDTYEEIGRDLDYKIIVDDESKEVIIQFKESDSDEDWDNNYLFFPWPLKLDNKIIWTSFGYARIYKSAQNVPFDRFYREVENHPDYKVVIWGWSIGSALAKIFARHFIIHTGGKRKIDELTTYGDVKCWYNLFYSLKKDCVKIREYVTANDLVTWCIPICRRDVKCKVGPKYKFKESFNSEYYHLHYEEYDYSAWEDE